MPNSRPGNRSLLQQRLVSLTRSSSCSAAYRGRRRQRAEVDACGLAAGRNVVYGHAAGAAGYAGRVVAVAAWVATVSGKVKVYASESCYLQRTHSPESGPWPLSGKVQEPLVMVVDTGLMKVKTVPLDVVRVCSPLMPATAAAVQPPVPQLRCDGDHLPILKRFAAVVTVTVVPACVSAVGV